MAYSTGIRMYLLLLLVLLFVLPTMTTAAVLQSSYYAPDRGTPYEWFEGAKEIKSFFGEDYRAAGHLFAYVRNDGETEIDAIGFTLDGKPLQALRDEYEVIWWRLLPRPLKSGAVGEVTVRLRNPLTKPCQLAVTFSDGSEITASIRPDANPLRIETVGFNERMDRVFVVAENLDGAERELSQVLVDGEELRGECRLLVPEFIGGVSPVSIRLSDPLAQGSYHVYTVRAASGESASCCVRTTDGWVPLGSYGHSTFEEFARNGCNGHNNFGRASKGQLDAHQRLGMRQVSMLGEGEVDEYEVGHPGLLAYCLMDEPDCQDYFHAQDRPHPLRIGFYAMEMEARAQKVRVGNPTKAALLTLDLTYKPANYYIYGPIADITNPDCYPVSLGTDATMVREVVETARLGAGPRQLAFTFQGVMEGPRDPEEFDKRRFPRPNLPAEQRIMMYYAIGAGARGLFNYIHCTENSETRWSRGSQDFPEVWNEIGQVYRELERVAPLLAMAHPTKLATSDAPDLWLQTLLCGEDAALLVYVNDSYEQKRMSVRYTPLVDVKITLPELPWLRSPRAYAVGADGFSLLASQGREISVPRIDVAGLILVSADPGLAEVLAGRYEAIQQHVGVALLNQWRRDLAARARQQTTFRLITAEFSDFAAVGDPVGAYGISAPACWNPGEMEHNAFEFGQNQAVDDTPRGATWQVNIPLDRVGEPHIIYICCGTWGAAGTLSAFGPEGAVLSTTQISGSFEGQLRMLRFIPATAGDHEISFLQPGPGPKGGRTSQIIYVMPESEVFDPALLPE